MSPKKRSRANPAMLPPNGQLKLVKQQLSKCTRKALVRIGREFGVDMTHWSREAFQEYEEWFWAMLGVVIFSNPSEEWGNALDTAGRSAAHALFGPPPMSKMKN